MTLVTSSFTVSWLSLDSWSETYVGARWLIDNVLPEKQYESSPEHGPISQMVLLASHHMNEVMLFSCLRNRIEELELPKSEIESRVNKLEKMGFYDAFTGWTNLVPGAKPFEYAAEPYISIDRLRLRRNATIHKKSALASLEMARSALYTAVLGSQEMFQFFNADANFKYGAILKKYPPNKFPLFSEVVYPEDYYISYRNT